MPTRSTMLRSVMLTAASVAAAGALTVTAVPGEPAAADDAPWTLPVRPDRCSNTQALSGDVGDCLMYFSNDAAENGFGDPPAPGVGEGWEWNGYTYSGSPALAGWEDQYIRSNTSSLAGQRAGYFETHVDAQALFEGFVGDITDRGYDIRHASAYSFRCTSGSGGWSCPSGRVSGLSLHAWGLAVDMNSDKNPIKSYSGVDGATACATPIETDMPQWVIQTAEKWGLYWGGYGWSSGCIDTTTPRSTVFRDPPHFEFRGTPEIARAIAQFNLGDDFAAACFPVVDDEGVDDERCTAEVLPGAGWRLPVDVEVPEGTTAALVNLAVTESTSQGHITLENCDPRNGPRETAALTFAAGQTVATMAVVPVSEAGRFCVYSNASVHRIIDVVGFLAAAPDEPDDAGDPGDPGDPDDPGEESVASEDIELLWFEPSSPTRLIDTRDGAGQVADDSESVITADPATILLANIATTQSDERGYLQAGGCGELGPTAGFSSLNYDADETRSNLALIRGNDSGTCVFALHETHVIVDELGRFNTESGLGWDLESSGRLVDTRECTDTFCDDLVEGGSIIRVPVETSAEAIVVALTATGSTERGYLWVGPCSVLDGRSIPPTSNLNHAAGETTTNLAIVALEDSELCVFNRAPGHVVIDVQAELTSESTVGVLPALPDRAHDSRSFEAP